MEIKVTLRHLLLYEYAEGDVLALRAPHREAHLGLVREWTADGRILMAGALGEDPPHGGALVFASDDPADARRFASLDPYVTSGLVARWRVEPWQTVA